MEKTSIAFLLIGVLAILSITTKWQDASIPETVVRSFVLSIEKGR